MAKNVTGQMKVGAKGAVLTVPRERTVDTKPPGGRVKIKPPVSQ